MSGPLDNGKVTFEETFTVKVELDKTISNLNLDTGIKNNGNGVDVKVLGFGVNVGTKGLGFSTPLGKAGIYREKSGA